MTRGRGALPEPTRLPPMPVDAQVWGPYVERSRDDWAALAESTAAGLDADAL